MVRRRIMAGRQSDAAKAMGRSALPHHGGGHDPDPTTKSITCSPDHDEQGRVALLIMLLVVMALFKFVLPAAVVNAVSAVLLALPAALANSAAAALLALPVAAVHAVAAVLLAIPAAVAAAVSAVVLQVLPSVSSWIGTRLAALGLCGCGTGIFGISIVAAMWRIGSKNADVLGGFGGMGARGVLSR